MKLIFVLVILISFWARDVSGAIDSARDPRLFAFFKVGQTLATTCRNRFQGVLINGECIRLFNEQLSWDAARARCQAMNADLWTIQETNDPFLWEKIVASESRIFETFGSRVWIGAMLVNNRIIDINNRDISTGYLAGTHLVGEVQEPGALAMRFLSLPGPCGFLDGGFGTAFIVAGDCAGVINMAQNGYSYVCEYPINQKKGTKIFG